MIVVNSPKDLLKIRTGTRALKPAFEYTVFGQTRIFVCNIIFEFARQSNIVFGCPNIRQYCKYCKYLQQRH